MKYCPKCASPIERIVWQAPANKADLPGRPLQTLDVLLDNIRSAYNVGSIFRTADGAGVSHIHLCGITPTPDHVQVRKTALGAEVSVPWTQHWNALEIVAMKRDQGCQIIGLEGGEGSRPLFDLLPALIESPVLLVLGNENHGIDPALRVQCDLLARLPMLGSKESLNVATAFGIAVYALRFWTPH